MLYTPFKVSDTCCTRRLRSVTPCKRHPVNAHSFAVSQRMDLLVKQQFLGFKGKINVIVLELDLL